jgi:hypothetical protein
MSHHPLARRLRRAAIRHERRCRAPAAAGPAPAQSLTLAELLRLHGEGSLPVLVMLLSLFTLIPVGGAGWFVSFFIVALGWYWARGRERVELPASLGRLALNERWSLRCLHALAWLYRSASRWLRPRWQAWRHERTRGWWGGWIAVMAVIIFLPLPFGNVLPSLSLVLLGLGWMFRDGLALLVASAAGIGALAYTVAFGQLAIDLTQRGWQWLTG